MSSAIPYGAGAEGINEIFSGLVSLLKGKYSLSLVSFPYSEEEGLPALYLCQGIVEFKNILPNMKPTDRAIIADSPVLLMEIPNIKILDLEQQKARLWAYNIKSFPYKWLAKKLIASNRKEYDWPALNFHDLRQVGFILTDTIEGELLRPHRQVIDGISFIKQMKLRRGIGEYLNGRRTLPETIEYSRQALVSKKKLPVLEEKAEVMYKAMEQYLPPLKEAVASLFAKKPVAKTALKYKLSAIECRYFKSIANWENLSNAAQN